MRHDLRSPICSFPVTDARCVRLSCRLSRLSCWITGDDTLLTPRRLDAVATLDNPRCAHVATREPALSRRLIDFTSWLPCAIDHLFESWYCDSSARSVSRDGLGSGGALLAAFDVMRVR